MESDKIAQGNNTYSYYLTLLLLDTVAHFEMENLAGFESNNPKLQVANQNKEASHYSICTIFLQCWWKSFVVPFVPFYFTNRLQSDSNGNRVYVFLT